MQNDVGNAQSPTEMKLGAIPHFIIYFLYIYISIGPFPFQLSYFISTPRFPFPLGSVLTCVYARLYLFITRR